ncbi:immunoglobulin superfamily member 5 [Trichomycterus rosablanca]|uniref:immunoglobulin superfamily member 5 n=1 Tax=Trichomycterus rosablanca TaxID=2290929 RepID=UPI002F36016B
MDIFTLAAVLLIITGGVSAQTVTPSAATVLVNNSVKFNCSASRPGYTAMTWLLNGRLAVTISESAGVLDHIDHYSVVNYSTLGTAIFEFIIKNVTRTDTGTVACQVQGGVPMTASLNIQQSGTLDILGTDRTVTEGDQVTFQCFATDWFPAPDITWALNGTAVNKTLYNTTTVANGNLSNSNSTFKLTAMNNASVECLASIAALSSPLSKKVNLTVRKPKVRDYRVLLGVVLGFGLAALLFLLIILILFCCKKRRWRDPAPLDLVLSLKKRPETRYEERVRVYSQRERDNRTYSRDNPGYAADRSRDDSSGLYSVSALRPNYNHNFQLPDYNQVAHGSQYGNDSLDYYSANNKHRHATIV